MEVLLFIFGLPLIIHLIFRLFGRQLAQLAMRKMVRTLEKQAQRQSEQFQRQYGGDGHQRNVYVDQDIKVSAPRHDGPKPVSEDEIAEDVDFEEVKRS